MNLRYPVSSRFEGSREARMRQLVAALWAGLAEQGVSWVGFYTAPGVRFVDGRGVEQSAGPGELLLAVREPKPACSPIGLEGMCGRSYLSREAVVVADVEALPPEVGYVACDPRDRSEVVVPCLELDGRCWGVLDLDSLAPGCFDAADARALHGLLVEAGLSHGAPPEVQRL
ncbi:MAG: GAF domain-containing protein [Planctomycetes bacterium]|nr:GAF domain-containing protein [Planctomycetota bacterium]